jgi:hypothetical protein
MRELFLIVPFLFLACADEPVPVYVAPGGVECNFPEAYTATYTKLNGKCGTFETESFPSELEPSWFPLALNLDDCEQAINCDDGIILGTSFCSRAGYGSYGTLDATLTFVTQTGSGLLELEIVATNPHHGTAVCNSAYEVTYK